MGPARGSSPAERRAPAAWDGSTWAWCAALANLGADLAMAPWAAPGSITRDPGSLAAALAQVPPWRLMLGTLLGLPLIATWGRSIAALRRLLTARSRLGAALAAGSFALFVPFAGFFHGLVGSLGLVGSADAVEPIGPLWIALNALLGLTLLGCTVGVALGTWGAPGRLRWLALGSPGLVCTIPAVLAQGLPAPLGAPIAMTASTLGMIVWLGLLERSRRRAPRLEGRTRDRAA